MRIRYAFVRPGEYVLFGCESLDVYQTVKITRPVFCKIIEMGCENYLAIPDEHIAIDDLLSEFQKFWVTSKDLIIPSGGRSMKIKCPLCEKVISTNDIDLHGDLVVSTGGKLTDPFQVSDVIMYSITGAYCPECGKNLLKGKMTWGIHALRLDPKIVDFLVGVIMGTQEVEYDKDEEPRDLDHE